MCIGTIKNIRDVHLFQEQYKIEVVETEAYFLLSLRYIHQNPLKAGVKPAQNEPVFYLKRCLYE